MHKRYLLLALLANVAFLSHAQNPIPESRIKEKSLASDGSPVLVTFRTDGLRYEASEAKKVMREQL